MKITKTDANASFGHQLQGYMQPKMVKAAAAQATSER